MSGYSPIEEKAIHLYSQDNNAVPQLSVRPMVRFKIRGTDEIVERHIIMLVSTYQAVHKEELKEQARAKKAAENKR